MGLRDRFYRGFICGVIAGMPSFLYNTAAYFLNFATLRWLDFSAILIYGERAKNLFETLFAVASVFFFLGILGIVFCYLLPTISSSHYLFKSWAYGVTLWFMFFGMTTLFKIPTLYFVPLKTAFSNFIASSIWGISLGMALKWFDKNWLKN